MTMVLAVAAFGWSAWTLHGEAQDRAFADPAPPAVEKPAAVEPPAARPNPEVHFHAKPKPLPKGAVTHDWTSFLGPSHNAVSTETRLLKQWPGKGPAMVWEMKKGTGYTSPAIQGDRLLYLDRIGDEERLRAVYRETGELYWEFRYPSQYSDRYGYNNGPRASPVIDGDRAYILGAEGKLHCLKLATGQLYWKRDLAREFKIPQDFFGTSATPLIEGDLLIVNLGAPGGPTVAGFDKLTGRMKWGAGREWGPSYASPAPGTVHGKRRVFVFAGGESQPPTGGLLAIDPGTGKLDFTFPWRSRSYESVNAATPVVAGDAVLISASYRTGSALLRLKPDGSHEPGWRTPEVGFHFMTPVEKDGYFYGYDGRNEPDASILCAEWKTGKVVWRETPEWTETFDYNGSPRKQAMSTYRGTLLAVDGHFLALGELGHLLWLDLTPKGYKELARAWLFAARETWALPVLSRGLVYISQNGRDILNGTTPRLVCYDLRAVD
jgi:outer membrane protein assembly factor BamB